MSSNNSHMKQPLTPINRFCPESAINDSEQHPLINSALSRCLCNTYGRNETAEIAEIETK